MIRKFSGESFVIGRESEAFGLFVDYADVFRETTKDFRREALGPMIKVDENGYNQNPLFQLKERLYRVIAEKIGEGNMTVENIVKAISSKSEILGEEGEKYILALQESTLKKQGALFRFVPDEIIDAIIEYKPRVRRRIKRTNIHK